MSQPLALPVLGLLVGGHGAAMAAESLQNAASYCQLLGVALHLEPLASHIVIIPCLVGVQIHRAAARPAL